MDATQTRRSGRRRFLVTAAGAIIGAAAVGAPLSRMIARSASGGERAMAIQTTEDLYFPPLAGEQWETVTPADAGWDAATLIEAANWAASVNTDGLILLHRGRIMLERYANQGGLRATGDIASAQKSVTSFLVGMGQEQGLLAIERPASDYIGAGWSSALPEKERLIAVRHLLTMSSGTDDEWRYVVDAGTAWYYNNPAYHLSKRALERAAGVSIEQYTETNLIARIGLQDTSWRVRPRMLMPDGVPMTGLIMSSRDMARFGLLVLADGAWDGTPLLRDTAYLRASTDTSQPLNLSYGYLWWLNGKATHMLPGPNPPVRQGPLIPAAPPDTIAAMGANDNRIYVVPSLDLVVVRQGRSAFEQAQARSRIDQELWTRLMRAAPR